MHAENSNSAIYHLHAIVGSIECNRSTTTDIDLGHLGCLECHFMGFQLTSKLGNELWVGITGSALSSRTCILVEDNTLSKERRILLVIEFTVQWVIRRIDIA